LWRAVLQGLVEIEREKDVPQPKKEQDQRISLEAIRGGHYGLPQLDHTKAATENFSYGKEAEGFD
jgi:hypothetical protein